VFPFNEHADYLYVSKPLFVYMDVLTCLYSNSCLEFSS